ncbi:hypothetical protein BJ138DRAFT_1104481 [Hygrophoropsis aurantiaca]|uniref:Uncharacterized protein n=1 Tax=Hygrophoropsis aurantiaca TaxID=72124 RepID=A0ACB8A1Q0_9AGAM|nr:hypothetical protein BJ138DRAFT_1104481 [Hygrophoropsis aurantiaca]
MLSDPLDVSPTRLQVGEEKFVSDPDSPRLSIQISSRVISILSCRFRGSNVGVLQILMKESARSKQALEQSTKQEQALDSTIYRLHPAHFILHNDAIPCTDFILHTESIPHTAFIPIPTQSTRHVIPASLHDAGFAREVMLIVIRGKEGGKEEKEARGTLKQKSRGSDLKLTLDLCRATWTRTRNWGHLDPDLGSLGLGLNLSLTLVLDASPYTFRSKAIFKRQVEKR